MDDFFLVHDGGKNLAELFVQGINVTENKVKTFEAMARRFGVSVSADDFY